MNLINHIVRVMKIAALLITFVVALVTANRMDDAFDLDMDIDDFEFELFQEEEGSSGTGETGVSRVENTVQTIEAKLSEMDELERTLLIKCDNDMNEGKTKLGGNKRDAAVLNQKIAEEKEALGKLPDIRKRLKEKMREVIKVLPKREQYRLIRKMDLRHRFSLGTEMDTA